ncbi:unnamed protein product [Effrenium voratum]|nr:unnamed protein product [Effrenium voratum]
MMSLDHGEDPRLFGAVEPWPPTIVSNKTARLVVHLRAKLAVQKRICHCQAVPCLFAADQAHLGERNHPSARLFSGALYFLEQLVGRKPGPNMFVDRLASRRTRLYQLLLGVVLLCSVATGYLDSALFSLCSQYSTSMQQYLQIGIGFGTLVSVVYRDATKLLLAHDIADATCAYFIIALVTVLVCICAYRTLMSLPISRHMASNEDLNLEEKLMDKASRFESPLPYACGFSPGGYHDSEESANGLELNSEAGTSFSSVLRLVWFNQLVIFVNFALTTFCYPGLITAIPCRQMTWLRNGHWFQTILLTVFTLFDISARFITQHRFGLYWGNVQWTAVVRSLLLPLMVYCAASETGSDLVSMAVVAAFGFLNGYCASLCLIVINEIPSLSNPQRKTCGRISACSVNTGLCVGSVGASILATLALPPS